MHVVRGREHVLQPLQRPECKRVAERLLLLHGEGNKPIAYVGRVRRRPPAVTA